MYTMTEKTHVQTFAHEQQLPRVPLPTLEQSCERFLEWCAPLLTVEQLAETKASVDAMLSSDSPARTLHATLKAYDQTPGVYSWLDTFWSSRYLGRRDRIALNANFFFLFKDTPQSQTERAASLIVGAARYKLLLDQERIPPAVMRDQMLAMEQVKYLFSTTRIPGTEQDTVRTPYSETSPGPSQARHIVVFYKQVPYTLTIIGPDGLPFAQDTLQAAIATIIDTAIPNATDTAVGPLTTKARTEWALSREQLLVHNSDALTVIETALFCLCLDDESPADAREACDLLLHGNSGNRWFDKSVSLIVFANGQAGINVEHCKLDGTTVLQFVDAIVQPIVTEQQSDERPSFAPIPFTLTDEQRTDIQAAADAFADYTAASKTISFDTTGTNTIKQLGISPDAFAQMAYQLAHKRATGTTGATYEAIATRHYRHGRTEAMRVVTPQVLDFVATMDDPNADNDTKRTTLLAAAQAHVERAKQCQAGQAPEQHLWELLLLQKRRGQELGASQPMPLYDSPGWTIMRDDYMSTSSAPSVNVAYFGFGSTSPHCIGIGYVLLPDSWHIYLSTPTQLANELDTFAEALRHAVDELQTLLSTTR